MDHLSKTQFMEVSVAKFVLEESSHSWANGHPASCSYIGHSINTK